MTPDIYIKKLQQRAVKNDPEAEWELGAKYDEGVVFDDKVILKQNPQKAYYWYKRAAKHGSSSGQLCLGYCYDVGNGVECDKEKALYWYTMAYKSGEKISASNIASVYKELSNFEKAICWYKKATELGDGDALVALGIIYHKGIGVIKNHKSSVEYFKKAIISKYITESIRNDALYYLGIAFLNGEGVKKNLKKAKELFKKANKDGDHILAKTQLSKIEQA